MKATRSLTLLSVALIVGLCVAGAELIVSAQNSNSSTTMTNANAGKPKTTRRRGTRKTANANAATQSETPAAADSNANMGTKASSGKRRHRRGTAKAAADSGTGAMSTMPKRTGRCDPMQQDQTDLSGTYAGTVNYADAGLTGDATLTITGNNFTLTAGSTTQSGRITAETTCGYTGATMMFGDLRPQTPSPNPPAALPAVSLRVRRMGDHVTLMTVPGETRSFSFGSVGPTKMARKHRTKKGTAPPPPPPKQ